MRPVEPQTSSRATRLVLAGIALTILLGVVAFVSRGHVAPAGNRAHSRGASQALANAVFTVWVLAMVAGVLVVAYVYSIRRRDTKRDEFRIRPLLMSLLFFAAVVVGMVFAYHHLGTPNPQQPRTKLGIGKNVSEADKKKLKEAQNPHTPSFNWYLAAGAFALILGTSATALVASRRRRSKLVRELTVTQELLAMLDETLDDIRAEEDPRRAVIAAYARMELILAAHDLARRPSEAPGEYLTRVLLEFRVTEESVRKLTELFERAKFSEHEIDSGMKEEAIEALVGLRDQLRVIDQPDKPALRADEVPSGAT